jgi:hypothetical protein
MSSPALAADPPRGTVVPFVDCVTTGHDGTIDGTDTKAVTVVFGYTNNSSDIFTAVPGTGAGNGGSNFVSPGWPDREQPSQFLPGTHHEAFTVAFDSATNPQFFWVLNDSLATGKVASSPPCDGKTTTSLRVGASPEAGSPLPLMAFVSRPLTTAPSEGSVEFSVDGAVAETVPIDSSGVASTAISAPATGQHTIAARFLPAAPAVDDAALTGSQASTVVTVSPAPAASAIVVADSGFSADGDNALFTVSRSGTVGAASVDYLTADGSALAGVDYTSTSGTVNFADGQDSSVVSVPVADRAAGAAAQSFFLLLQRATTTVTTASATAVLPAGAPLPGAPGSGAGSGTGTGGTGTGTSGTGANSGSGAGAGSGTAAGAGSGTAAVTGSDSATAGSPISRLLAATGVQISLAPRVILVAILITLGLAFLSRRRAMSARSFRRASRPWPTRPPR